MNKLLRGIVLFVTGLGASIAVGWWLKQREEGHALPFGPPPGDVPLDLSKEASEMTDLDNIPLPPEAFEDVESEMSDAMVITSEVIASNGAEVSFDVVENEATDDDLTQINGIGPKTVEALAEIEIASFKDLATSDPKLIKEHVSRVSLTTVQGWIKAAQERI
jgi:predicted flap endonuclease-1-like 5' DNA nuclease